MELEILVDNIREEADEDSEPLIDFDSDDDIDINDK